MEADLHQELDHMVYDDHIQCCVLGCTHYPLVSDTIEKLYPDLPLIDPAQQMAWDLRDYLTRENLLRDENLPGRLDVFTTGDVDEYALRARQVGGAGPGELRILSPAHGLGLTTRKNEV